MNWSLNSLFNIDRRIIFVFVFLAILLPMVWPFPLTVKPISHVQTFFDTVDESASGGGAVFLAMDWGPAVAPELEPAARAIVRHVFSRGGRVVMASGSQDGADLHKAILLDSAQEYGAVNGKDFAYLGFMPSGSPLIINMGQNFASAYPTDADGRNITELQVMRGIAKLGDFDFAVSFAAGLGQVTNLWLAYAQNMYGVRVGAVVTAVLAPDLYNYLNSRQLTGLIGGLIGAAQYESLLKGQGGYIVRRFTPADLDEHHIQRFCRMLAEPGPNNDLAGHVWNQLTDEQQQRVRKTASEKAISLTPADRQALVDALNTLIDEPIIPDSTLADIRGRLSEEVASLLADRGEVRARQVQVLRRLHVQEQFGQCLGDAQADAAAVRRMVPQAVTHIGLILVIIVGNVCYLWDRARKARQSRT